MLYCIELVSNGRWDGVSSAQLPSRSASQSDMTSNSALKLLNSWKCVGGYVKKFVHFSSSTKTDMKFSVYFPPSNLPVPALYWLSGLTCTDENFIQKAGAFKAAAEHGVALIVPDTSPRGANLPNEKDSWDFGEGAGFYVNATQSPWSSHYRMYDYITQELPALVQHSFPEIDASKKSIFGHSMGGHGALICFLKNPSLYTSVSAFAPICNPINCPWGQKAFNGFLGSDTSAWAEWDASQLAKQYRGAKTQILVDQGSVDEFLAKKQLLPESLIESVQSNSSHISVQYRVQEGYDHSYFFISTFIQDHIQFHAQLLKK